MQRRGLLKLGLAASAVLALGGGVAALLRPALADGKLTPEGRQAVGALAEAVLQGSLQPGAAARERQVDAFEVAVSKLPAAVREELVLLLSLLLSGPGRSLLTGRSSALHEHPVPERQALLQGMRLSSLALRQQAYFALRDLHAGSFFASPEAWGPLGYPGPRPL